MKKNVENRRLGALERLEASKFFPKVGRTVRIGPRKLGKKERRMRLKLLKTELDSHK